MSVENRVPSVRKQKIKKNHTKTRLIIFPDFSAGVAFGCCFCTAALPL